jgi:Rieske Fe-S protein
LISGNDHRWAELYNPARKSLWAAGAFLRENLNVAGQYTALATPGEVESTDDVPPGQGAILRRGLTKCAIYRDPQGRLTELSAICSHLGCVVAWNAVEGSWDCPCHGSRFTADGKVFCGPANRDLAPARPEDATSARVEAERHHVAAARATKLPAGSPAPRPSRRR